MGRTRSSQNEINKGTWSKEEDEILFNYVTLHGEGKWQEVARSSGLKRCAKSCRYRFINYLKPGIKRGDISKEEEYLIIKLQRQLGKRWAMIAKKLPGRTDIEIKNYWKIYLAKKLHHQDEADDKEKTRILEDIGSSDYSTNISFSSSNVPIDNDNDDDDDVDDLFLNNIDQNDQIGNSFVNDSNSKIQEIEENNYENKNENLGRHGLKGAWSRKEDQILSNYVAIHGEGHWNRVAQRTGLKRCGKSCRHRFLHYLKPGIKRGNISKDEEDMIVKLHRLHGNRWTLIAKKLPGRTDSEIKNYWHAYLSKKSEAQPEPWSSCSPKANDQNESEKNIIEQINSVYTPQVHFPISTLDDNFIESPEDDHHDPNNTMSMMNSFEIEYDEAFLDGFLSNVFQNDGIGDEMNSMMMIPQIHEDNHYNMFDSSSSSSSSSFHHQQYQLSEDVLDFWTSSEFPFFN